MTPLTPKSEAELADMVATATDPLRIIGGGTRPIGTPVNAQPLTTSGLTGVSLYEPGALTMVAQAGTPLAEIEKTLATEGQRLAFEPMDHRGLLGTTGIPTIGGVFAANVSGPRRIQTGAARDFLLGVRFVDGQGQITRNGGRVMKNVTGYDIVKLMAGSYGTLGVMTELSFKVLPDTHTTGVLLFDGLSDTDAVKALCTALGSPFEVSGAAHLQTGLDGDPVTMIRVEGSEKSVTYRLDELQKLLTGFGTPRRETDPEKTTAGWRTIRNAEPFHKADGDIWRLSVKPTDAPGIVAAIDNAQAIYDWGGGLVWLNVPTGTSAERIRAQVGAMGGHATLIRGRDAQPFQPLSAPLEAIQAGLRARFDPQNRLNPGLMGRAA